MINYPHERNLLLQFLSKKYLASPATCLLTIDPGAQRNAPYLLVIDTPINTPMTFEVAETDLPYFQHLLDASIMNPVVEYDPPIDGEKETWQTLKELGDRYL